MIVPMIDPKLAIGNTCRYSSPLPFFAAPPAPPFPFAARRVADVSERVCTRVRQAGRLSTPPAHHSSGVLSRGVHQGATQLPFPPSAPVLSSPKPSLAQAPSRRAPIAPPRSAPR